MTLYSVIQLVIFSVLLLNPLHLIPAFGRFLRSAPAAFQSGYLCSLMTLRLARTLRGFHDVTARPAATPPVPAPTHALLSPSPIAPS